MRRVILLCPLLAACTILFPMRAPSTDAGPRDSGDEPQDAAGEECVPACEGRRCGDDGCGGECPPGCTSSSVCTAEGRCCIPTCDGVRCGVDSCGVACGCPEGSHCNPETNTCCDPEVCADRLCGDDGCGGQCGPGCAEGEVCDESFRCCTLRCDGRVCGDDECGGECAPGCGEGERCSRDGERCIGPLSWAPADLDNEPSARRDHAMASAEDRGSILMFGGTGPTDRAELWEYEAGSWSQIVTVSIPPQTDAPGIAYDSRRNVLVMFGGQTGARTASDETWEYDGEDWSPVAVAQAPPERWAHAMAFDEDRGVVVLFGGTYAAPESGEYHRDDTWEFDGEDWTEIPCSTHPDARRGSVMEWDADRGVIVLFGGSRVAPEKVDFNDTWEYDGTGWRHVVTANSPSPVFEGAGAFDGARGVLVVFSGADRRDGVVALDEVWEYDGEDWLQIAEGPRPVPRYRHEMAYGPADGAIVVFGGRVRVPAVQLIADTWIGTP